MSELAHYIDESYHQGATTQFPNLFATVENILQDPDNGPERAFPPL
jgi:hypothetical protein